MAATISSPTSAPTASVTITTTQWWEFDPTDVSSATNAQFVSWQPAQVEQSTSHVVLHQVTANVVAAAMMAQGFGAQAEIFDAGIYTAFESLLTSQKTIFISSPWGVADSGYFRIGPSVEGMAGGMGLKVKSAQLFPSTSTGPHRTVDIVAIPQPRPNV